VLDNLDKKFVFDLSSAARQSRIKLLHQSLKPRGFAGPNTCESSTHGDDAANIDTKTFSPAPRG
jgi:hypothetical protein